MKINTQQLLKDLDGKELENVFLGKTLAQIIIREEGTKDPLRNYTLATKLNGAEGELELDKSELEFIKNSVKTTKIFNSLVSGQILSLLS